MAAAKASLARILRRVAVAAAMVIAFFPIYWLVQTSFKPQDEWASWPPVWMTEEPTLQNYRIVFAPEAARRFAAEQAGSLDYKVSGSAWHAFADSAVIATLATFFSVVFGTLAAYSIVRYRTGGPNYAFQFLTIRMFPPIAVVVPMVVLFSLLRLTDTIPGMVIAYTAFTLPFSIWMIRSFIEEVPEELEGAAMIHGMSPLRAFLTVTLPLIKGGVLATALFVFILNWSDFLIAKIMTQDDLITAPVYLQSLQGGASGNEYGLQAALACLLIIPPALFGLLIQRYLVRGLTFGAIKR
jgi:multiple sugar transport system permease protein